MDHSTAERTVDILRAIQDWRNPIHIATKMFPASRLVNELKEIFEDNKAQLIINISVNGPDDSKWNRETSQWLRHSSDLNLTIYIKPVRDITIRRRDEYIKIGRQYENLSFVIGSLYLGDSFKGAMNSDERAKFRRQSELVSPVVPISSTPGFRHSEENNFAEILRRSLGNRIFRTASCALSAKYQISDPLGNLKGFFCVMENCPNYSVCNRTANIRETGK